MLSNVASSISVLVEVPENHPYCSAAYLLKEWYDVPKHFRSVTIFSFPWK